MEHVELQPNKRIKLSQPFSPRVVFTPLPYLSLQCLPGAVPPPPPFSTDMLRSILSVEDILGYKLRNPKLLEDALTHSSYAESASYERLEFFGDSVLNVVVSYHVFSTYRNADPGVLSSLRSVTVSTENLARVAVRHGMHKYFRHNVPGLNDKIKEFEDAVRDECDSVIYGGSVKAPKVLADIVESVAAAVYVDLNCDQQKLWMILKPLMEPLVTPEDLQPRPQPVTMLYEICQKNGKYVHIKHWRNGANKSIASVLVDGTFVASGSSHQKDLAKLNAAKAALAKLSHLEEAAKRVTSDVKGIDASFEIEAAKQSLHELCGRRKWPKPEYRYKVYRLVLLCIHKDCTCAALFCSSNWNSSVSQWMSAVLLWATLKNLSIVQNSGPPHAKKYVCSVKIPTSNGTYYIEGEEKTRVRDAENSASSLMIRALQERRVI